MRNLVVFGDSPFAERISIYIREEKQDNLVAFTLDKERIIRTSIDGIPILPLDELDIYFDKDSFEIILGIGYTQMNNLRSLLYNRCISLGYRVGSYISNNAIVYTSEIGDGSIILPNVLVGPRCKIGVCTFFESSCALSHDNIIGNFNFLSTNAVLGGNAKVGNHCFIGLHSTIKNSLIIPDYTLIGSGANLIKSPEDTYSVYTGNPAKRLIGKNPLDLHM
ncbi:hypothetical protein [Odoribacter laneus]